MYVSSTDPVPLNCNGTDSFARLADSNARKQRVFNEVAIAASRYACAGTVPTDAFSGFSTNFLYQVQRAVNLLNNFNAPGVTTGNSQGAQKIQQALTSTGTSGAPNVIPLNPVDTNPKPKQKVPNPGPFDTPQWGEYTGQWPVSCLPGGDLIQWLQQNPWLAIGGAAALLLAGGAIGTGAVRRRRARR